MKVFKKDGMLTKPAEYAVRVRYRSSQTSKWDTPIKVGETFRVNLTGDVWVHERGDTKFRIMADGSIQSPVYDYSKKNDKGGYTGIWTLCANPPTGGT